METVNQEANANVAEPTSGEETKTFTQEEVDRIVNDRLYRERSKYADYESLKTKAARFDELEEANKTELQKAVDRADSLKKELDALKADAEIRDIREKVSQESGIPVNLLTGTTEDDCKAQAAAIKAYANPAYPNVRDAGEPQNTKGHTTQEDFKEWFENQFK